MELLSSLSVKRIHLFLKSPDEYDPLQIFLNAAGSQEFGVLVGGSVFSGADWSCFYAFILLELPPTAADMSQEPVSSPPP